MPPPTYNDLGKSCKDLFNKGYNFGFMRLDTTTKTGSGVEFKTTAAQNVGTGKLFGCVDVKYKVPKYGMTLTERWNTDNNLGTEIVVEDQLMKGLKLTVDSSFAPSIGKRMGKAKAEFSHENFRLNTDVSLDLTGPIVNFAGVGGYDGWLLGYQTGVDTQRSKMTHSNVSFGRNLANYSIHAFAMDANEFGGSFYHKVNKDLELGANMGWTQGEQTTRFGLAAKYQATPDTAVRAKVTNTSQVAVACTQSLNPELKLTVSTLINLQNFNDGGHKFGMGLEYEP